MMRSSNYITIANKSHMPKDAISCVRWDKTETPTHFLVSSWDGSFRIYQVHQTNSSCSFTQEFCHQTDLPITCFDFTADLTRVYLGYLNGRVASLDPKTGREESIVQLNCSPRAIVLIERGKYLCCFDVDGGVKMLDLQSAGIFECQLDLPVSCVDYDEPLFAVGFASSTVAYFDVDTLLNKRLQYQVMESKNLINAIHLNVQHRLIIVGYHDGRITYLKI